MIITAIMIIAAIPNMERAIISASGII